MLVAVLLVEFAIKGDFGMKDATCQVDSESQNLIFDGKASKFVRLEPNRLLLDSPSPSPSSVSNSTRARRALGVALLNII